MTQRQSPPSPPRARITFRVGIVGHRPNRLPSDPVALASLQARLDEALVALRTAVDAFAAHSDAALYSHEPPVLRALTPLAEGVDRMFAEAALAVGCQFCCPMPFARREFENDFGGGAVSRPDSVDHFHGLMDRARDGAGLTIFELDGSRDNEGEAYAAAGRVVLNQSDLLIAVWDGGAANGDGGTHESLGEALRYSVPVLWIDARAEHGWMMVGGPADLEPALGETRSRPRWSPASPEDDRRALAAALGAAVAGELAAPPAQAARKGGLGDRDRALAYFAERKPGANFGFIWKLFRDLVGAGKLTAPAWRVPHFVDQIAHAWPTSHTDGGAPPSPVTAWTNESLRAHYAWADRRADLYGDAHRSAFVTISLLAAAAVFLALLPLAAGWGRLGEEACILAEFLALTLTLGLLWLGNTRRWHLRWLEYRVLAELIRQLRILIPLGGGRPMPSQPAHLAVYGDPTRLWMYWHMRAIARAVGIPHVTITPAFAGERVRYLRDITGEQIDYYVHAKARSKTIHGRLHALALLGFGLSIAAVALHGLALAIPWGPGARDIAESLAHWLILISAGAPAFGAALASINNQGEFARLEKRSGAMVGSLGRVRDDLHALAERFERGEPVSLAEVIIHARAMAAMMVEENADWRVVVIDLAHGAS